MSRTPSAPDKAEWLVIAAQHRPSRVLSLSSTSFGGPSKGMWGSGAQEGRVPGPHPGPWTRTARSALPELRPRPLCLGTCPRETSVTCSPSGTLRPTRVTQLGSARGAQPRSPARRPRRSHTGLMRRRGGAGRPSLQGRVAPRGRGGVGRESILVRRLEGRLCFSCLINHSLPYLRTRSQMLSRD